MAQENGKERCKACYPCPMGVVGCGEDVKPHGHGNTQKCPECGVPYTYIHPHSNICSRGTPINMDVAHSEYYLNMQLEWKKIGININTRDVEKEIGDNCGSCGNCKDRETDHVQTDLELKLIPKEEVIIKQLSGRSKSHAVRSPAEEAELRRFALMVINDRIAFCQKYKTGDEEIGKCACESIRRYIRLSKESASRAISKDKLCAIKKLFEEMKKEGKIKCPEYKLP